MVYRELRDRGYIVTPGIKFGSDFAVYEHGPGIDHAPYIIQVMVPKANLTATGIVRKALISRVPCHSCQSRNFEGPGFSLSQPQLITSGWTFSCISFLT